MTGADLSPEERQLCEERPASVPEKLYRWISCDRLERCDRPGEEGMKSISAPGHWHGKIDKDGKLGSKGRTIGGGVWMFRHEDGGDIFELHQNHPRPWRRWINPVIEMITREEQRKRYAAGQYPGPPRPKREETT